MIKAVYKARRTSLGTTSQVCYCFLIKRNAYYKYLKRFNQKIDLEQQVLKLVKTKRRILAREGTRKLHKKLYTTFKQHNLKVGRDSLFDILRENNMLIKRKRAFTKTTNSYEKNISTFIYLNLLDNYCKFPSYSMA